jgi:hypothetical protein
MNIPSFSAESSVHKTNTHYCGTSRLASLADSHLILSLHRIPCQRTTWGPCINGFETNWCYPPRLRPRPRSNRVPTLPGVPPPTCPTTCTEGCPGFGSCDPSTCTKQYCDSLGNENLSALLVVVWISGSRLEKELSRYFCPN